MSDVRQFEQLNSAANQLAELLCERQEVRIVFAESCTGGLVSAALAQLPGISQWLCGSAVTYREQTKIDWLEVQRDTITEYSVVSDQVARQMASGVLRHTAEASWSAAITGHLGPHAPDELDGIVYIAVAGYRDREIYVPASWRIQLETMERTARQYEAATQVIQRLVQQLR